MGTDRPGVTRPSWLAEPHERQRVGCVETLVTVFGFWLPGAGGFDSGRSFVAARLNRLRGEDAHVLAQLALFWWKLVEPACERQRVGRVETSCACLGNLGGFWLPGVGWCRFGSLVSRGPAQPASGRECSRAGSTGFKGWGLDRGVVVGVLSHVHSCVVPRAAVPRPIPPGSEGSKGK